MVCCLCLYHIALYQNKSDVPTPKHPCDIICKSCSGEIFEATCQFPSVNPTDSNSKIRLKPCARFGDFARLVCIKILLFYKTSNKSKASSPNN